LDGGEEVVGELVVAGCDAAPVLQSAEHALDRVAATIEDRANLKGANLRRADVQWANLYGADLREANLGRTNLGEADLTEANLSGADLSEANLIDVKLDYADLTGAKFWETQRAGWSIKNVVCQRAFWDREGMKPTEYSDGEFERLYVEKPSIVR
jgi:uncharacterized protein YjbI with pentapeptide repeats